MRCDELSSCMSICRRVAFLRLIATLTGELDSMVSETLCPLHPVLLLVFLWALLDNSMAAGMFGLLLLRLRYSIHNSNLAQSASYVVLFLSCAGSASIPGAPRLS